MITLYVVCLALKMGDDRRRVMYDGFNSETLGHSNEWVKVKDEFVESTFASEPCVAKCPCRKVKTCSDRISMMSRFIFANMDLCPTIWCGASKVR